MAYRMRLNTRISSLRGARRFFKSFSSAAAPPNPNTKREIHNQPIHIDETHRRRFISLSSNLGIPPGTELTSWYRIRAVDIRQVPDGAAFLKLFGNSTSKMLESMVPEHTWLPWMFRSNVRLFWQSTENQKRFLDWLKDTLNLSNHHELAKISPKEIERYGGRPLLRKYNSSLRAAIDSIYCGSEPAKHAVEWSKYTTPERRRDALVRLEEQLGIKKKEDWYSITYASLRQVGGFKSLFDRYYSASVANAVRELHPDHEWLEWRFTQAKRGFWKEEENQRAFLEWLVKQESDKELRNRDDVLEAIYSIDASKINAAGGRSLLTQHGYSMIEACKKLYPSHSWIEWRLQETLPTGFWQNAKNRRKYFDWLSSKLGLKTMDDWYSVTVAEVYENRGSGLLSNIFNNTLSDALFDAYPDHKWSPINFRRASVSSAMDREKERSTQPGMNVDLSTK